MQLLRTLALAGTALGALFIRSTAWTLGATLNTIAAFNGTNGAGPNGTLIFDSLGNLYGTTRGGGADNRGTVFRLNAANGYTVTTLGTFNGPNGYYPSAGLAMDAAGNLYGTTMSGGSSDNGTAFKLDALNGYAMTTIVHFNGVNGRSLEGSLLLDAAGNLYGTSWSGGPSSSGNVFRLNAASNYTVTTLFSFNHSNGSNPQGDLLRDAAGNLYGVTLQGGPGEYGTVYRLNAANGYSLSTLATFNDVNGSYPQDGVIMDAAGNLFGTTSSAGATGFGKVFELDASDHYAMRTLATFTGSNGSFPYAGLLADPAGNLYGTTTFGGANNKGTVFKLDASNGYALVTLATFNGANGRSPFGRLVADRDGNLYGTAFYGGVGSEAGLIFRITGSGFVVPEPSAVGMAVVCVAAAIVPRRGRSRCASRARRQAVAVVP